MVLADPLSGEGFLPDARMAMLVLSPLSEEGGTVLWFFRYKDTGHIREDAIHRTSMPPEATAS